MSTSSTMIDLIKDDPPQSEIKPLPPFDLHELTGHYLEAVSKMHETLKMDLKRGDSIFSEKLEKVDTLSPEELNLKLYEASETANYLRSVPLREEIQKYIRDCRNVLYVSKDKGLTKEQTKELNDNIKILTKREIKENSFPAIKKEYVERGKLILDPQPKEYPTGQTVFYNPFHPPEFKSEETDMILPLIVNGDYVSYIKKVDKIYKGFFESGTILEYKKILGNGIVSGTPAPIRVIDEFDNGRKLFLYITGDKVRCEDHGAINGALQSNMYYVSEFEFVEMGKVEEKKVGKDKGKGSKKLWSGKITTISLSEDDQLKLKTQLQKRVFEEQERIFKDLKGQEGVIPKQLIDSSYLNTFSIAMKLGGMTNQGADIDIDGTKNIQFDGEIKLTAKIPPEPKDEQEVKGIEEKTEILEKQLVKTKEYVDKLKI